ncbi:NUDIX hydrolase [Paenibacillus soyae]|uniref:NUDIX domain-containing protein n=1 Tax=Paenibacillus soyae TaxID=2969249 RepID=A0A9X2MSY9_9BACL|nr:NUDIX domain-containing protein [Paenibacillus soyae]MCR2805885.1 NUDIX domain-containing protein [Paenibacillus soyae]
MNFAGAVICNENKEVLLQKRADREAWGLPGGAMELGESAAEAAIREVLEETGLIVETKDLIGAYTKYFDEYPNGDKAQTVSFFFECKVVGGELQGDGNETLELAYFPPDRMPPLFVEQHEDVFADWRSGARGVCR